MSDLSTAKLTLAPGTTWDVTNHYITGAGITGKHSACYQTST